MQRHLLPPCASKRCREQHCLLRRTRTDTSQQQFQLSFLRGAQTSASKELRGVCWQREEQLQRAGESRQSRRQRLRGCSRTQHL